MHVSQLWRYPVKSMIGEQIDAIEVTGTGVTGDRIWATRDLERGGIRGAKKIPLLMKCESRLLKDGHVEIITPTGEVTTSAAVDVNSVLSDALGQSVELEALRPASDSEHFRRGAPDLDDPVQELRNLFGRVDDEPIPNLGAFPRDLMVTLTEYESPPGSYYDMFPLMMMSEQSISHLKDALPNSAVDVRRFRPTIVIDAPPANDDSALPELSWVGQTATIGSATIEFVIACPRCVMVTRAIDDSVGDDRDVLRYVVRELNQDVGVYAKIVEPGTVSDGDELIFI
jgi:uncharacterized protein YcbX